MSNDRYLSEKERELVGLVKAKPSTIEVLYDQSSSRSSGYVAKILRGLVNMNILAKNGELYEYVGANTINTNASEVKPEVKEKPPTVTKGAAEFFEQALNNKPAMETFVKTRKDVKLLPDVDTYPDVAEFYEVKDKVLKKGLLEFIDCIEKPDIPKLHITGLSNLNDKRALLLNIGGIAPEAVRDCMVSVTEDLLAYQALLENIKEAGL